MKKESFIFVYETSGCWFAAEWKFRDWLMYTEVRWMRFLLSGSDRCRLGITPSAEAFEGSLRARGVVGIRCLRIFARCVRFTIALSIFGRHHTCRIFFAPYIQVRGQTAAGHWIWRIWRRCLPVCCSRTPSLLHEGCAGVVHSYVPASGIAFCRPGLFA
mgnify:CR=1 FL=1